MIRIEALDERFDFVRHTVAVGVANEENLRARGGDESILVRQQPLHVIDVIREDFALRVAAVLVRIKKLHDARERLLALLRPKRIIEHVRDEAAALRVPCHLDRIEDERLAGDELGFVRAIEFDGFLFLLRRPCLVA